MKLQEIGALLRPGASVHGDADILDLAYDSRKVAPGALFFCLKGNRVDGLKYADQAAASGAAALVCERPPPVPLPYIQVPDARVAMNRVAAPFYGHPSRKLTVAGITGTNGKTTVAFMLESIFRQTGEAAGIIGTVETRPVPASLRGHGRTTPESVDFQKILAGMADLGVTRCAAEVTSIGLAAGRVQGTHFSPAVFTNLSPEHLDFHGSMEAYYRAKAALFSASAADCAAINVDDRYGRRLAAETSLPCMTFGTGDRADLRAEQISHRPTGWRFIAGGRGIDIEIQSPLPGYFNVMNALAAAAAALLIGISPEAVAAGIAALRGVPGRLEPVSAGQDFTVLVDFAHTPDALQRALEAGRELAGEAGRLIAVFGCGGDRDRQKRPLMGKVAVEKADLVIATSDNPRSEDPMQILAAVEKGMAAAAGGGSYEVVADRREAIARAVSAARAPDIVIIAGKGHETYQEVGGRTIPFDDREEARRAIAEKS